MDHSLSSIVHLSPAQDSSSIVRRPSSIVHRPSSIVHRPPSTVYRPFDVSALRRVQLEAMESEAVRLEARVRGRVQGVGFRAFVWERARGLGLGGYVRNEWDGSVLVVAEGPRARLNTLLAALREGPPGARVSYVEPRWAGPSTAPPAHFEVRG